ncbi:MAG: bifunctional hydroxymethylpyrimidine kinase/phosphomethylpyrimidine kinase [Deltaproteobacteria bacterium]|nr:bifunctional hydroxymethylpyrimidine kinase/phosphomethylpyrimidine kinase [Deltaproteobacteria bacterium]
MSGLRDRLRAIVASFENLRVTVLGDPVLDVYVYGTTLRISREAPVPIVREDGRESRLGGAANAAANLASLGAFTQLVGVVGDDSGRAEIITLATRLGIDASGVVGVRDRRTVTKTRILAGGVHTTKQQLLRIDRENDRLLSDRARAALAEAFEARLDRADALVVSDYEAGDPPLFYAELVRRARTSPSGVPVVAVDSRFHLNTYEGVTMVTPNEPEAESALGVEIRGPKEALAAAESLRSKLRLEAAILTRGKEGMVVASERGATNIPRHGSPEAVDVTGAGDTVTAVVTLARAAGATFEEAAVLANLAAARVVQVVGTATCTAAELEESIAEADLSPLGSGY